jgi:pyruvate dehydrogenase E2 component (dihydrolipoamide acetyltransferase)
MAEVIMPKMGDAMEEGTLLKWLKNPGDEVAEGDPIAEIETDKVTLELEASEDGFLTNTLVDEGATVPIGTPVATIGSKDEVGQAPAAAPAAAPAEAPEPAPAEAEDTAEAPAAPTAGVATNGAVAAPAEAEPVAVARADGERLRASPLVKRLASEHNIDLALVAGTGPGGRIVKADIADFISGKKAAPQAAAAPAQAAQQAPAARPAPTPVEPPAGATPVEISKMKLRTGERMAESKQQIPHFYVSATIDMAAAMAFREQVNASIGDSGPRISVNDFVIKAAALALAEHPNVNRAYVNGQVMQPATIDVNIAVAVDGGLIAPFIPNADQKSLGAISAAAKDLGRRAREGGLKLEEFQGGTFTISNLGMFDVDEFIAVINPPQAAILAVASVREVPVVKDGELAIGQKMQVTLAADHRVLDGAEVAIFLQSVRKFLENPMLLAVS